METRNKERTIVSLDQQRITQRSSGVFPKLLASSSQQSGWFNRGCG